MVSVVGQWSGREAWALRVAMRLSVRDFAARLGINDKPVSNWESRGRRAQPRHETQQLLDLLLKGADDDAKARFELLLRQSAGDMGGKSAERTGALLATMRTDEDTMPYVPDERALETFKKFLLSAARVFVLTGSPGCGKTQFTYHLATSASEGYDYQYHKIDSWNAGVTDLASEILRYSSLSSGDDPLLTLENASTSLNQPCVVILDGINTHEQLDQLSRQVDSILRQVSAEALRFVLTVRTPPEVDLSAYPVLAASVYASKASNPNASYNMEPWDLATAEQIWNQSRPPQESPFHELPSSVQALTRRPLYMRLLKSSGNLAPAAVGEVNTFRLIDHCVRAVLHRSGQDVDRAATHLVHLAQVDSPDLIPDHLAGDAGLARPTDEPPWTEGSTPAPALVQLSAAKRPEFVHDVIREYFLAVTIARLIESRGRSAVTVGAFNDLARKATTSATALGVFEFVLYAIDTHSPDLAAAFAVAPTIAVDTTLPLILRLATAGARFTTDDVIRTCAKRCAHESGFDLARALLTLPAARALGDDYAPWILGLIRRFGSRIWPDIANHLERTLDVQAITPLLAYINLDRAEEAIFLAQHFHLFTTSHHDQAELLELLHGHPDWRVRAALAASLGTTNLVSEPLARRITRQLAHDDDYKVQSAVAQVIGRLVPTVAREHVGNLLTNSNWHVRSRVLEGILATDHPAGATLRRATAETMASDPSWSDNPHHVGKLRERLLLLEGMPTAGNPRAREHALFRLLRELRTGRITLAERDRTRLLTEGQTSSNWLVHREAEALAHQTCPDTEPVGVGAERDRYRRRRDGRSVQVALDLHDLDRALSVATAAAEAGADFIEVGDPLIKTYGVSAVERVKQQVPDTPVVAEMMSSDWGRDQVELAVEAGADVILLIGPASIASVSAAAEAARRLDAAIVLDIPAAHTTAAWVRDMERAGVDGFAITTNIDLGVGVQAPLTAIRTLRGWTRLPVAVSGGFSATDHAVISSKDWDIMIVGRSICDAVHPRDAARQLVTMIHHRGTRLSSAHQAP
jgi:3-keto-L-gulonate-6-phosphate decarboxylase/transcriptional regulator with XRE-family HTH domain